MNTFRCRSCNRQFQSQTPRCPTNPSHIVDMVRTTAQLRLAASQAIAPWQPGEVSESAPRTPGTWTRRDRELNTHRWKEACRHNLLGLHSCRYTRIIERRDFYRWFYNHTADLNYTTRWALAASIVATGAEAVAIMNPGLEDLGRLFQTVNDELQGMMREGNQVIFDNVFPKLRQLLLGGPLTGLAALQWDMRILSEEQTLIQPLYEGVSFNTRKKLDQIARQKGLPGTIAYVMPNAYVDEELPYVQGGRIPSFQGVALTSVDERWLYGMSLGKQFTPGGTPFNPAIHKRPPPSGSYVAGSELARVRTRPTLHRLDAALDLGGVGTAWLQEEVETLLWKLTLAEQTELLRDEKPDGGRYSVSCRLVLRPSMFRLLATWRIDLEAQMRFLSGYIGGDGDGAWRDLNYRTLAPIIRPFSRAEKNRLHTPFWQRIFTLVCDDDSIVDAVTDLGVPEPLRTQWLKNERSWGLF